MRFFRHQRQKIRPQYKENRPPVRIEQEKTGFNVEIGIRLFYEVME